MYFTSLPDHSQPGFDEQLHFSKFKKHNIIYNALSSRSHCDHHVGCLSIKTVLTGEEWYGINHRRLAVRPGQFLILNDDQEYSSTVDTPAQTNVLSVFFRKEFAWSVFSDTLRSDENSLDNPTDTEGRIPEFFQTLYDIDLRLQETLLGLVKALNEVGYETNMVDEHLFFLLNDLILTHKREAQRAGRVGAIKPSTRLEIYKRICMAKDHLHSNYMQKPDLTDISAAACLSVPQLVRQFKAVFQTTPHQYLTEIRLAQAVRLLKDTRTPVHEITRLCGFEDVSAFCRVFKSSYGVQPISFRKMSS